MADTDIEYSIPKDGQKALDFLQKKTAEIGQIPFWRPNKRCIKVLLPKGVRPYPEVAQFDSSFQHTRNDYVLLKYKDGVIATIPTKKLYKGHVIYPADVTHKWVVVKAGEKNLKGTLIEEDA